MVSRRFVKSSSLEAPRLKFAPSLRAVYAMQPVYAFAFTPLETVVAVTWCGEGYSHDGLRASVTLARLLRVRQSLVVPTISASVSDGHDKVQGKPFATYVAVQLEHVGQMTHMFAVGRSHFSLITFFVGTLHEAEGIRDLALSFQESHFRLLPQELAAARVDVLQSGGANINPPDRTYRDLKCLQDALLGSVGSLLGSVAAWYDMPLHDLAFDEASRRVQAVAWTHTPHCMVHPAERYYEPLSVDSAEVFHDMLWSAQVSGPLDVWITRAFRRRLHLDVAPFVDVRELGL